MDTIRGIVGLYRGRSSAFVKGVGTGERDEADARAEIVCVMGDGTGMPMRRECLRGVKGKDGRAKTREVKAGAIFVASKTRDNEPHRNLDTTTYVATTHRREKFGKYLRNEFDRSFAAPPGSLRSSMRNNKAVEEHAQDRNDIHKHSRPCLAARAFARSQGAM